MIAPVRTGLARSVDAFATDDATLRRGDRAIVRTPRGTEVGEVLLPPREGTTADARAILRRASRGDLELLRDLTETWEPQALRFARRLQRELLVGGKLVAAEHLFGGERIVYYFVADTRVELAPLLRALAAELGRAVELHLVGARGEARLLGDVGPCGIAACGREFLGARPPAVTLRDVLPQRAALDPAKLHGACGLLKDCLRFEASQYRDRAPPEDPGGMAAEVIAEAGGMRGGDEHEYEHEYENDGDPDAGEVERAETDL